MALTPNESGKLIASLAENVKIKDEGVKKLGDLLVEEVNADRLTIETFSQNEFHPKYDDPAAVDWLFVVDTLNFCFWQQRDQEKWTVEGQTGYFALCAAINRAIQEKVDILNPKFLSTITEEQLKKVLRSDTKAEIPLLTERVKCLQEVGSVLLENFEGTFKTVVKQADNSAKTLLELIVDNFKCFRDEAEYKNHKVCFQKRAQILIGDIWACFKNKELGYFKDIEELTMFADYRIPQTLLWFDVLEYTPELMRKLKEDIVLKNGDEEEIEIRGCSIHAVELVKQYVSEKLTDKKINSVLIDHFLWDFRRNHAKEIEEKELPFHKTFSIYY